MSDATALAAESATLPVATPRAGRLDSIDLLRGLVMVIMAIDHVRDYVHFGATQGFDPLDLRTTTPAIFFTRWITHFCAPIFSFLAGTGVFLSIARGKSKAEASWFLVSRGLWLIALELTVLTWFGWNFGIQTHELFCGTLWALGTAMIVLAALIHLPMWAVLSVSLVLVLVHNALDGISPESFGAWSPIWKVLHVSSDFTLGSIHVVSFYPLIPWIGVMPLGYALGALLQGPVEQRRRRLLLLGSALVIGFVALRASNVYGDLHRWQAQSTTTKTVLSFLSVTKYPPSLCYLLMTLGPAMLLLAWFDRGVPKGFGPILVFGRVPMFYYLLHIPLAHAIALLATYLRFGHAEWMTNWMNGHPPATAGWPLWAVYAIWFGIVVSLYPLCRWFAEVKRRNRSAWLTYF